jgi:hypothetical protein
MKKWMTVFIGLIFGYGCAFGAGVQATKDGLSIDTGAGGIYVIPYPHLVNPGDKGLLPENIVVKPDGTGMTATYQPTGKLDLGKQPDGSWLFHFTQIPSDRMKFSFSITLPLELAGQGATWSFDGADAKTFPADKGPLAIYHGFPKTFSLLKNGAGFTFTYPQKTWTQLMDLRSWGQKIFKLGEIYYFPGKKTAPEISYTLKIDVTPAAAPAAK